MRRTLIKNEIYLERKFLEKSFVVIFSLRMSFVRLFKNYRRIEIISIVERILGGGEDEDYRTSIISTKDEQHCVNIKMFLKQLPTRFDFAYMLMSLKSLKSLFKLKHFHYATKSCENENKQTNLEIVSRSVKKNGTSNHPIVQISMVCDLFEEFRSIEKFAMKSRRIISRWSRFNHARNIRKFHICACVICCNCLLSSKPKHVNT